MGLDSSQLVADSAMESVCNPSWTYMHHGFSHDCIALHVGVPLAHNSSPAARTGQPKTTPKKNNPAATFFLFSELK